jgi:hypothetical protein
MFACSPPGSSVALACAYARAQYVPGLGWPAGLCVCDAKHDWLADAAADVCGVARGSIFHMDKKRLERPVDPSLNVPHRDQSTTRAMLMLHDDREWEVRAGPLKLGWAKPRETSAWRRGIVALAEGASPCEP